MPKDRSKTYSDNQSQAARLKRQQVKTKAQPEEGKPAAKGGASAPSPKPVPNVTKKS